MLQRSANAITSDEVLAILSKIQSKYPIGNAVLDAQIALDPMARRLLTKTLSAALTHQKYDIDISKAISEVAVMEVCDSNVCPRCKGTGEHVKQGEGVVQCSRCNGVGNFILSNRALHKMIINLLPEDKRFSRDTFRRKWYDIYMSAVDKLHTSSGDASGYAKKILRQIEDQEISLIR
jgi:hypothetical protein